MQAPVSLLQIATQRMRVRDIDSDLLSTLPMVGALKKILRIRESFEIVELCLRFPQGSLRSGAPAPKLVGVRIDELQTLDRGRPNLRFL